ncbi:MAG: GAF domain-containing protein [Chloroflexi bacterium]|nr:MAG: GAF domain-containing protein [Chloroflexota bacterium]
MVRDPVAARRRHEEELAALFETAAQLTSQLDLETVLQTIVDRARSLIGTDLSYITLLDREACCVRMRVAAGNGTAGFMDIVLPLGAGLGGIVARDVRPIYTSDYLNDPAFAHEPDVDRAVRAEGIRSILGVPLIGRRGTIGVLYVANRQVNAFAEPDVELLSTLGHHAALALENARLYEEAVDAARASEEAKAVAEAHYRDLSLVHEIHQRLTDVLLAGEGVVGVARSLASTLEVGIAITDRSQFVMTHANPPGIAPVSLDGRGCLPQSLLRHPHVRSALLRSRSDYQSVTLAGLERMLCPVATRQELLGFIWATLAPGRQPSDVLRTSLEQAARAVALELLRDRAAVEIEARLRREFLDDLLSEHPMPMDVLRHRARQVWQSFAVPHRPFICHITADPDASSDALVRARQIIGDLRPADFVSIYGDRLIGLLPIADRHEAQTQLRRVLSALARQGLRANLVVGGVCRSLEEDRRVIVKARELQDLVSAPAPEALLWLERLEVLTALFEPSASSRLAAFMETTLGPLRELEARQATQLLRTLDAYYQALGNRAQAARGLGIHINTLYKRLDRLNELVGPLDDPVRAVPLQVAVLAWAIRHPM